MKLFISLLTVLTLQFHLAPLVYAEELATANTTGSYTIEVIKVVVSLAIVLGVFYVFVNIFQKYSGVNIKNNSAMRIVGGLSLGGKDKLVILNTGDINLLLGVSAAGITKLHEFEADQQIHQQQDDKQVSSFGQQINKYLNK